MPRAEPRSRANQFADEPESEVRMQPSGRRGESSQKTRCGLIGSASLDARARPSAPTSRATSPRSARATTRSSLRSQQRHERAQRLARVADEVAPPSGSGCRASGRRCRSERRAPAPSSGRNSEYGKLEPTISSVSQSVISSQLGLVPSRPIEPVTNGRSSGSDRLAEQRLGDAGAEQIGDLDRPRRRRRARPAPTSIATRSPALRTSAARRSSSSRRDDRAARA